MKKFIITVSALVCLVFLFYYGYYYIGIYFGADQETVTAFTKADEEQIYLLRNGEWIAVCKTRKSRTAEGFFMKYTTDFSPFLWYN